MVSKDDLAKYFSEEDFNIPEIKAKGKVDFGRIEVRRPQSNIYISFHPKTVRCYALKTEADGKLYVVLPTLKDLLAELEENGQGGYYRVTPYVTEALRIGVFPLKESYSLQDPNDYGEYTLSGMRAVDRGRGPWISLTYDNFTVKPFKPHPDELQTLPELGGFWDGVEARDVVVKAFKTQVIMDRGHPVLRRFLHREEA